MTSGPRSSQTIERKRAEARAERELAASKRQEAQRAREEVPGFSLNYSFIKG